MSNLFVRLFCQNKFVVFVFFPGEKFSGIRVSNNFVIVLDRDDRSFVGSDHLFDGIKVDI